MKRFKLDGHRRPDMGNRRRVDDDDSVEVFAEDITIDPSEVPDRKRCRYDAEDLVEKAEREALDVNVKPDGADKADEEEGEGDSRAA